MCFGLLVLGRCFLLARHTLDGADLYVLPESVDSLNLCYVHNSSVLHFTVVIFNQIRCKFLFIVRLKDVMHTNTIGNIFKRPFVIWFLKLQKKKTNLVRGFNNLIWIYVLYKVQYAWLQGQPDPLCSYMLT